MIVLGLILVIVAIAAAVLLVLGAQPITATSTLETGIFQFKLTPLELLIAGAVIMLLLWFGLGMMRGSMKRKRRPGREAKDAQRQADLEESIRADERNRAEETHTAALADRDRAKDAELESKLAERDRTRDEEFRTREREIEDRVRADERTRLEREFSARQTTTAAAAPAAIATGAAATHDEHRDGVPGQGDHGHRDHGVERTEQVPVAAGSDESAHADQTGRTDDGSADERLYSPTEGHTDQGDATDGTHGADGERPAHRTMADRIMGRDPQGHN